MGPLAQVLCVGTVSWLLWKAFRQYFRPSCLDHLPGPKPNNLLLGLYSEFLKRDGWPFVERLTKDYEGVAKIRGIFGQRILYLTDPLALYTVFVKEPNGFEEHIEFLVGNHMVFGPGLIATTGDVHRKQRKLLGPAFAPSHLRKLTPAFVRVSETIRDGIIDQVKGGSGEVDMMSWLTRGALEIIGQGGLGYSFDPLSDPTAGLYANALKNVMPSIFDLSLHWIFAPLVFRLFSPEMRRRLLDMYPNQAAHKLRDYVDLLWNKSISIIEARKSALGSPEKADEATASGNDIMSLLLKANMKASEEDKLPDDQLIAQVNTIVFAATETTSNSLARLLHLLSEYPAAQERLRREIVDFRNTGNELTYENLMELPYLGAICRETLRMYPPVLHMERTTQKDTVLPLSKPIRDVKGQFLTEIPITKGTALLIGIHGFNRSRTIWGEDADVWNPDRWLSPLSESAGIPSGGVYHNLMTFLGGPRSCIGFKYAEFEMKTLIVHLIETFRFSLGTTKIVWNTSHIVFPSVSKESSQPEMPLRVEVVSALSTAS